MSEYPGFVAFFFYLFLFLATASLAAVSVAITAWLLKLALERVLCVAALVEAAIEAREQGRAPLLRAWLKVSEWGRND